MFFKGYFILTSLLLLLLSLRRRASSAPNPGYSLSKRMEDAVSTNTSTAESVIYDSSSSEGDDEFMLFKMEYPPASTLADSRDFDRILDSLDDDEADDGPYNILMEFAKVAQHYSSSDDDSGSVSSIESETASPSTAESELDDSPLAASLTPKLFKEEKGENPLFFDIEFGDSDHLVVTTPEEMKLNEETHSNT